MRLAHFINKTICAASVLLNRQHPGTDLHVDLRRGCFAVGIGQPNEALVYFNRAMAVAQSLQDAFLIHLLNRALVMVQQMRDLHQQRALHHQAYVATDAATIEVRQNICRMFDYPALANAPPGRMGLLWLRLLFVINLRRVGGANTPQSIAESHSDPVQPEASVTKHDPSSQFASSSPSDPVISSATEAEATTMVTPTPEATLPLATTDNALCLTAQLFGPLRVTINDEPLDKRPSGRGRAVFTYLLTHRDGPIPSEVMMDVFWPGVGPKSARNSLNVALHSLRQSLRTVTDQPVIVFQNGAYSLNPNISIWLDVDEFEKCIQAGAKLKTSGKLAEAIHEYEAAIHLYQGEFLADDPYEDWAVLARERLRVNYLETVDQLSQINFDQANYTVCISLCRLIMARDQCREDVHCRLMMCFARQNQHHLALRQYQACVEALRKELNVVPTATTRQLYERVRHHENV